MSLDGRTLATERGFEIISRAGRADIANVAGIYPGRPGTPTKSNSFAHKRECVCGVDREKNLQMKFAGFTSQCLHGVHPQLPCAAAFKSISIRLDANMDVAKNQEMEYHFNV
jgi:hypothetical protein